MGEREICREEATFHPKSCYHILIVETEMGGACNTREE